MSAGGDRDSSEVRLEESADHPGWMTWELRDTTRFDTTLGPMVVRAEGGLGRVRMFPERRHTNPLDAVHGGAILAFIDIAMFVGAHAAGAMQARAAVTLDCATQFLSRGMPDQPLDAVVEVLRETGRLVFVRGLIEQGETKVAAFSGTLRKSSGGS